MSKDSRKAVNSQFRRHPNPDSAAYWHGPCPISPVASSGSSHRQLTRPGRGISVGAAWPGRCLPNFQQNSLGPRRVLTAPSLPRPPFTGNYAVSNYRKDLHPVLNARKCLSWLRKSPWDCDPPHDSAFPPQSGPLQEVRGPETPFV